MVEQVVVVVWETKLDHVTQKPHHVRTFCIVIIIVVIIIIIIIIIFMNVIFRISKIVR